MAKPLITLGVLPSMRELILEKSLINVVYVPKPLIGIGILPKMREFILGRNLTNVNNVTEFLTCAQNLLNT